MCEHDLLSRRGSFAAKALRADDLELKITMHIPTNVVLVKR